MKRIWIIVLAAACALPGTLRGQNFEFGGSVLNHDMMWAPDLAQLSRTHNFGTARAMGMGGAFVSLGADLSAMAINPAGLGMYRSNELSITPMLSVSNGDTEGLPSWTGGTKTRFAFGNLGCAINVYESSKSKVTSLTLGIGMNRVSDFNTRYSFTSESAYDAAQPNRLMPTVADIFAQQLYQFGVRPASNGSLNVNSWNPNVWPAILGYDAYMVDNQNESNPSDPFWQVARIGANASVMHSLETVQTGAVNEFDISLGGNVSNILYFGATIGVQSVHKRTRVIYQEEYGYAGDGVPVTSAGVELSEQMLYSNLLQEMAVDGSGINFKLGFILRPVAGLRLGVAFHTPTYYSLDRTYRADIEGLIYNRETDEMARVGNYTNTQYDEEGNSWDFVSPARLMFGASYTFGSVAILSVDYERDWYNGIRVKNLPAYTGFNTEFYKQEFKHNFQGTNSIRAGLEVKPMPRFALRAGGGYTGSMLRDRTFYDSDAYASMPSTWESCYFSAGAGFTFGRGMSLDFAYQHLTERLTASQLFFSRDLETGLLETYSGLYETKLTHHYISMTFGVRF